MTRIMTNKTTYGYRKSDYNSIGSFVAAINFRSIEQQTQPEITVASFDKFYNKNFILRRLIT